MAGVCLCSLFDVTRIHAQEPTGLSVTFRRQALHVGDRTELVVEVVLEAGADARVALTPSTEGTTLEVVRGRLLTFEAQRETDEQGRTHLRFAIPVIAHAPGAGVLRVDVDALVCRATCSHVQRAERFSVEVDAGRPSAGR